MGNITSLSGPLGAATNYAYDNLGRLISESTSSCGTISYEYNELNLKEKMTNARGQERKYFYDAAGRVIGFVGEEESVSYTYDQNGNVLTVSDSKGTIKREYDALNRVTKCTDVFGKVIRYEYDAVGNLRTLIYPDGTMVRYTYDVNNNLETVTDWMNRTTTYSYDVNHKLTGVIKPDGSITTTVYDDKQRVVSTVEKTPCDDVITGFEYTYDSFGRIETEKNLAKNIQLCYTYDELSRVTNRTVKNLSGNVIEQQSYSYDAAGNCYCEDGMCGAVYDINNRLTSTTADHFTYDADGNLTEFSYLCSIKKLRYDSSNRLTYASKNSYTYNAEDTRICLKDGNGAVTEYTYNTNCKLSQLLQKTTNGTTTKYVYGHGLIGEASNGEFKTYHFDYRGSTVALTDSYGYITDTFEYDTYGLMTNHQGTSNIIFGYNGRDGVITDNNGLLYMRARYYFPPLKRFLNADILHGEISDSTSLNRYSYVNGNPVSFVDPSGMTKDRGGLSYEKYNEMIVDSLWNIYDNITSVQNKYGVSNDTNIEFKLAIIKLAECLGNQKDFNNVSIGTKVRVEINPNYNTSGGELIGEILGFIPVYGELLTIADLIYNEDNYAENLTDLLISAVTNENISELTSFAKELDSFGKVVNFIGAVDFMETLANWNSSDKIGTEISVFLQSRTGGTYKYQAIVDNDLMFKEIYSGYTNSVFDKNDPYYEVILS